MADLTLHTRILNFVQWIRPDPDKIEETRRQRDDVKARIQAKANADGLTIRSMPHSGSFAKSDGLRRHMLGGAEHEGQDVDCAFVLATKDEDGESLADLLPRFERYAKACYPDTELEPTRSSVRLNFSATKLSFDLVPMLAVADNDDEQILLRAGGERRRTSIQKHVEFVKARTKRSQELRGPVAFNDAVRLVKWWREWQETRSKFLTEVPSFLVELLCAKAFDQVSVKAKYPETLVNWFDAIYSYAGRRMDVTFGDFVNAGSSSVPAKWRVIDPVNSANNAVPSSWGGIEIDEFRDWTARARDKVKQAIAHEMYGRNSEAVALLAEVFGSSFANHSEE